MEHVSADGPAMTSDMSVPRLMSRSTTAALQDALDTYGGDGLLDSRLRPAARMVCADARASGLRVEHMLIALKSEWGALLEQHRIPHGAARHDLTSRFITLCIHAFYAGHSPLRDLGAAAGDGASTAMRS